MDNRGISRLRAFTARVLGLFRSRKRDEEFDEEIHTGESPGGPDPEIQVLAGADKETLRRALDELPGIFREVLVLREMEGMSYKEIADVASVSIEHATRGIERGNLED